jgi:hypothetical protein
MKKQLLLFVILFTIFISFNRYYHNLACAQENEPPIKKEVTVFASVGELTLDVSGYIAPFASVVMTTTDGVFMRSAVANSKGYFYISQVLIKKGFSGFCLTAVDFKRLGESTTCLSFPPAQNSISEKDLFLPPTLGLLRNEIAAGSTAIAFGYTMPFATVTLHLSDGTKLTAMADKDGYYEFKIKDLKAGLYQLFATAKLQGKESLKPTKFVLLKSLSVGEQIGNFLKDLLKKILQFFTSIGLGPLWLAIPILILIIILILKLWPEKFTYLYESKLMSVFHALSKKKRLHHYWFIGY